MKKNSQPFCIVCPKMEACTVQKLGKYIKLIRIETESDSTAVGLCFYKIRFKAKSLNRYILF